jgi:preprotein translocase subunit SecA
MFQDLLGSIRSQVVTYVFTYQYRGLARLEEEKREIQSRQIAAPSADRVSLTRPITKAPAALIAPARESARAVKPQPQMATARAPIATKPAGAGQPGRNDPCWCGSGKKYKHCHMESDLK